MASTACSAEDVKCIERDSDDELSHEDVAEALDPNFLHLKAVKSPLLWVVPHFLGLHDIILLHNSMV